MLTFPATRRAIRRSFEHPWLGVPLRVLCLFIAGIPYVFMRSAADDWRPATNGVPLERAVFGGSPTRILQHLFYSGHYGWFEHVAVYVHTSWFILPPAVTLFVIWRYRNEFGSYMLWHVMVTYLAVACFALLPVEPPWYSDPHVVRILALRMNGELGLDTNPFAAMPSFHVALPLTLALWSFAHRHRALGAALAVYTGAIGFGVVFLGEHYLLDVIGAGVLAFVVARSATWLERRPWRAMYRKPSLSPSERVRASARYQRGQGLVEFAMVAPLFLVFMFIIIDFGVGLNHRVVVTNAAREAARYGATGKSVAEIQQRAVEQSEGLVKNTSDVQVTFYDTDTNPGLNVGDSVAVKILYSYKILTPLPAFISAFPTSLEMNACTDMRLEQVSATATAAPAGSSPCQ